MHTAHHTETNKLRYRTEWMLQGQVQKLVIAISGLRSGAVLERWSFNIETTLPKPGQ